MKVDVLENIEQLESLYQQYGLCVHSPYHDLLFVSEIGRTPSARLICIKNGPDIILSAFTVNEKQTAICEIPGYPFITNLSSVTPWVAWQDITALISKTLGHSVYFPLVYKDSFSFDLLKTQKGIESWERLPSLIISDQSLKNGLARIALERIGSRAARRIKKFNKNGFQVITTSGTEAINMIEAVERASWKEQANQDMISRKQLHMYEALNRSAASLVRVVLDKNVPVAYRFDYRAANTVYILKWSFNEQYRQYSPGFYLLVEDMPLCWSDKNIRFIDLHGSPDTLKTTICDTAIVRERYDFAWSQQPLEELKRERLLHDQQINIALAGSKSLKSIYLHKDQISDLP